jgi:hypothetical protein
MDWQSSVARKSVDRFFKGKLGRSIIVAASGAGLTVYNNWKVYGTVWEGIDELWTAVGGAVVLTVVLHLKSQGEEK